MGARYHEGRVEPMLPLWVDNWCEVQFKGRFRLYYERDERGAVTLDPCIEFQNDADAVHFRLRWGSPDDEQ
jgi:hypothetical protein